MRSRDSKQAKREAKEIAKALEPVSEPQEGSTNLPKEGCNVHKLSL